MNQTNINFILADISKKHWIKSAVVKGSGIGKTLGFPTINLVMEPRHQSVQGRQFSNETMKQWNNTTMGVYSCKIKINRQIFKGLLHYGPRPTFKELNPSLEIHVLDFNKEIKKGKKIQFKLLKYLRKIKKFKTKEDLVKQIRKDIETSGK